MSYKEVAEKAGNTKTARTVGRILNSNKNLTGTPYFRVIKLSGERGGYKLGVKKKLALLKAEGF